MPFRLPTRLLRPLVVRQNPLSAVHCIIHIFLARNACPKLLLLKSHTLDALEHTLQGSRAQASLMSASTSVQEPSQSLWDDITSTYERARAAGAAYQTDTNTELYMDPQLGIEFVLRVAAALRDKPKPPKDRHVPCFNALPAFRSPRVLPEDCYIIG